ncbi:hypothetical protein D9M72_565180 [compost metagenome]
MGRAQRGGEGGGVKPGKRLLGFVDAADQQQPPDCQIARMGGVDPVAVRFKGGARAVQRLCRPAQVARDKGDLRFGHHAPGARYGFARTEGARRAAQQCPGADEVAKLRHGDPAQRQRRRIVAQGNPVQRAKRITRGERERRGGNA